MPSVEAGAERGEFRWVIAGLLFLATFINYIDRQTFSIAAPKLAQLYHLSNSDIAAILNLFNITYTFAQVLSGKLIDTLGTRVGFALIMLFWSLADAGTASARGFAGFAIWRFALGLGEAGT